jgi:hypothetical protein
MTETLGSAPKPAMLDLSPRAGRKRILDQITAR